MLRRGISGIATVAMAVILISSAPLPAHSGRVLGRVSGVPRPPLPASHGYSKYQRDRATVEAPPNPLIVILNPSNPRAMPAPGKKNPVIDQQNERFIPRALPVQAGTTVDFLNSDSFYHNVFSLSAPRKFDLGRYRKGNARQVTFSKPGLVKLFCDIHPDMIGYVLVTESPWFASATVSGDYEIEAVPAGDYDVELWYESLNEPVRVSSVQVGEAGETRLDLAVPEDPGR
jgi:plastocyanin